MVRTLALKTFAFAFASATSSRSVFSPTTGNRPVYDLIGLVNGGSRQLEEDALLAAPPRRRSLNASRRTRSSPSAPSTSSSGAFRDSTLVSVSTSPDGASSHAAQPVTPLHADLPRSQPLLPATAHPGAQEWADSTRGPFSPN